MTYAAGMMYLSCSGDPDCAFTDFVHEHVPYAA